MKSDREHREDRVDRYYQESAWVLAERIVNLEDELARLKRRLEGRKRK